MGGKELSGPVWYGKLETSKSSTVVIRDDALPDGLNGRIYLYNSDRGQIVEYVESIVSSKLRELTEEEVAALDKNLEKKFTATREAFLKQFSGRANVLDLKPEKPEKNVVEEIALESPDGDLDDSIVDLDDIEESWDASEEEQTA